MKLKRIAAVALSFAITMVNINVIYSKESSINDFSDIYPSDWCYNTVSEMIEKGYISGYDDGTFRPEQQMTRAEFMKVLFAAVPKSNEIKSISDISAQNLDEYLDSIKNHWYYKTVVEFIERAEMLSDAAPMFSIDYLNENITRGDVATLAYIAAATSELDINLEFYLDMGCIIGDYGDCLANSNCKYILMMYSSRIIAGKGSTRNYAPNDYITRAEACAVISRIVNEDERISRTEMQSYEMQHEDAPVFNSIVESSFIYGSATHDTAPVDYSYLASVSKGTNYGGMTDSQKKEAQAVADSFISNYIRPSMSDLRKVSIAAEYIMNNCSYGSDTAESAYTAWGALVGHAAWCTGFSYAFKMLCDSMDIGCVVVPANQYSENPSHMWNEVEIDGYWYVIDVQVMDLVRDYEIDSGTSTSIYFGGVPAPDFLVSYESYVNRHGMACDTENYPACNYDYFVS